MGTQYLVPQALSIFSFYEKQQPKPVEPNHQRANHRINWNHFHPNCDGGFIFKSNVLLILICFF
jgi:hypothetical protein